MTPIKILFSSMLVALFASFSTPAACAISTATVAHHYYVSPQYAGTTAKHKAHFSWLKRKHRTTQQDGLKREPLALISFILGILSILTTPFLISVFIFPFGIILSIISLIRIKRNPDRFKGKKMATWSLVLNIVALALWVGLFVYLVNNVFE